MSLKLEVVAENLGFPEGPVAMADGSVLFVDIMKQTLSRLQPGGQVETVAQVPGGPNGAAVGPDGAIYICNNGGVYSFISMDGQTLPGPRPQSYSGGSIQRVDLKSGAVTTLYEQNNGAHLLCPDDLVFDTAGGFWFTDYGIQDPDKSQFGALYYATPDGRSLTRVPTPSIQTPNGVGLSPDGSTLYVADTLFGRLWALDVAAPGKLKPGPSPIMPGRVVKTLPDFQWLDSLKVEADGRVCVGTLLNGGITVFTPQGQTKHVSVPSLFATNLCFGGADMRDVWITASTAGKIYKARWPRPGLKLAFNL